MNALKVLLASAILAPVLAVLPSCTEVDPNGGKEPDTDGRGNSFVTSDYITPIRYTVEKYVASSEGVSITVTENGTDNIKFICEPGNETKAYRINLYPVSTLYNALINQLNETGAKSFTVSETADMIYQIISNTESETSGGKLMNKSALGDDYSSYEFDWMNSGYAMIDIKPNAGYMIVAQAFFDEAATAPGDLCLCFVQTKDRALVGNPTIELNVETGFYSYRVTHVPNDDCKGYYYLGTETAEIQQYIDVYGENMFKELLCHYGALVSVDGELSYDAKDKMQNVEYCTTALAVDVNGTPSKTLARKDFFLARVPENIDKATGYVRPIENKIAASVCHFEAHLDANCIRLAYNAYPSAEADEIMAKDEAARQEFAALMVFGGSQAYPAWQVGNPNYAFDKENGVVTGTSYDSRTLFQHEMKDDTEYKIIYACMNGFGQASDLMVSEPFRTKKLVYDNPALCTAECTLEITDASRSSFTIGTKYNSENTANIYWQYYSTSAGLDTGIYELPKDEEEAQKWSRGNGLDDENGWLYWFLTYRDPIWNIPWPNQNMLLFGSGWGTDSDYFSGFDSGITVYFAYMVEDWNGVLSEVKFFHGDTKSSVGGDNPAVTISWELQNDGNYALTYQSNDETSQMKYLTVDNQSGYMETTLRSLMADDFDGISYEEYVEVFEEYVMQNGLDTRETTAHQTLDTNSEIVVSIVLPIGGVDESKPVYGEMQAAVYRKSTGKIMLLKDYMNK